MCKYFTDSFFLYYKPTNTFLEFCRIDFVTYEYFPVLHSLPGGGIQTMY